MEKHLTRNIENKKLAGVCAGLADYFNLNQTLVRVIFVIGLFAPIVGLLLPTAYLLLWFFLPKA